jgi:hypothetical protein
MEATGDMAAVEEQRKEYHIAFGVDAGDALIEQEYFCNWVPHDAKVKELGTERSPLYLSISSISAARAVILST